MGYRSQSTIDFVPRVVAIVVAREQILAEDQWEGTICLLLKVLFKEDSEPS